jgi:hypothetical protein
MVTVLPACISMTWLQDVFRLMGIQLLRLESTTPHWPANLMLDARLDFLITIPSNAARL